MPGAGVVSKPTWSIQSLRMTMPGPAAAIERTAGIPMFLPSTMVLE